MGICAMEFFIVKSSVLKDLALTGRTRYLGEILKSRGYRNNVLERLFSKCVTKYAKEFQKWYIPLNIKTWFCDIFKDQPTGLIPPQTVSGSFSQPLGGTVTTTSGVQIHHSQP